VAAVVAVILALLALRWLIAVLSPAPHARNIVIAGDHSTGRTTLTAGALDDALTADIETYRGVHSARARVYGDSSAPRLHVTVGLDRDADLAALRHRIETSALEHARHALDEPQLPIRLELAVTRYRTGRVT
jgi:hypothetical protein